MISSIYDSITLALKEEFKDEQIFEAPVTQNFHDGDLLCYLKEYQSSPVPAGLSKFKFEFVVEKHSDSLSKLYEDMARIEKALLVLEIDDEIQLNAVDIESKIENSTAKVKVQYQFYGRSEEFRVFMGEMIFEN